MGKCASGNIFQAKIDKLLSDIEGVKMYINYILIFSKYSFKKKTKQLIMIFERLCASGLKVNAPKCKFWIKRDTLPSYYIA